MIRAKQVLGILGLLGALAGIALQSEWLVWGAIGLLAVSIVLRMTISASERRNRRNS